LLDRRTRLHQLLLALIKKEANFEMIQGDSSEFVSVYGQEEAVDFSQVIKRNRKILNKYNSLIKTAVTLDALMDSENDQNYKITK
tara:strand:- start:3101 stop:3355 length:255 start_codon:yes stop_codon:yes gene_type:complete